MDPRPDVAPPLQFETAITPGATEADASPEGVACKVCGRTLTDEYFDVNGQSVCGACRDELTRLAETPRGWRVLARALAFGIGAAILGAVVYYAVIAITEFEIGIVAIAIGFMVGYGIRLGTGGRGGRRFQIMAVVLTYWAVGLAYTPLLLRAAAQDSSRTQAEAAATPTDAAGAPAPSGDVNAAFALSILVGLSFALPVMAILGSMPGGLITAAIIAFGMQQAWGMTAAPRLEITGPYEVSPAPPAPV